MGIVASTEKGRRKNPNLLFYNNYAVYVFRCLKKPIFQKFLKWVLNREKIQKDEIKNVQIRIFPSIKKNGNCLNGKCNSNGELFLYPKRLAVCRKKKQKIKSRSFREYIEGRARASLIHELLHIKYRADEKIVKKLTKKYYSIFQSNNDLKPLDFEKHQELIFNY